MAVDESSGEVVGWVCWEVVDAGKGGGNRKGNVGLGEEGEGEEG